MPAVSELLGSAPGPFFVIAGPCVIESREVVLETAVALAEMAERLDIPLVFKASYLKDNRTSGDAFRGPGIEEGLDILREARERTGLPVLSDVHLPGEAAAAAAVLDIIQIPAFLCRQTSLIEAVAATGTPLNIKKGQFLPPSSARFVVEKARAAGAGTVAVTERGASFGYGDLVVDPRTFPLLAEIPACAIFDATHSLQQPGGSETGGDRRWMRPLARAALAAGARGLFLEAHPDPDNARSDRGTQLPLADTESFLREMRDVARALVAIDGAGS